MWQSGLADQTPSDGRDPVDQFQPVRPQQRHTITKLAPLIPFGPYYPLASQDNLTSHTPDGVLPRRPQLQHVSRWLGRSDPLFGKQRRFLKPGLRVLEYETLLDEDSQGGGGGYRAHELPFLRPAFASEVRYTAEHHPRYCI